MTFEQQEKRTRKLALGGLAAALAAGSFLACGAGGDTARVHHEGSVPAESKIVALDAIDTVEFGLKISAAGPAVIEEFLSLTGQIRSNEDQIAHIVPRYGGIVKRTNKQIGDAVRSGETLAVIESSRSLSSYSLKTMIDGVVIEKHITLGEAVDAHTQAFVVADLSTVWVDLDVYMRDRHRVKAGQTVLIKAIHGQPQAKGVISYVTPVINTKTRTATARVVLDNKLGQWHPGMFTIANLLVGSSEVKSAVPKTAIHSLDDEAVVFVLDADGYSPRTVTIGLSDNYNAEVKGEVAAGENIVEAGGFTVKSELMRSKIHGGHGH
ncbi:MAG: efflux RND transporter periplasmic adaptor subunit [Myxococcota bacterium]|nr:efflux RND transporter periplasmic adaptor subunit [Myxococcota bacterium]